jgi:ATP-dependent DNA helicase RecG
MQAPLLQTPIEFLKGVGPQRADLLKRELQIFTYFDLLQHYPFRWVDRSQYYTISQIASDQAEIQVIGKITQVGEVGEGHAKRLVAQFEDETGSTELVWFKGIKWVKPTIKLNQPIVIYGKPSEFRQSYNFVHPEMEALEDHQKSLLTGLQPVYSSTEKLSNKGLSSKGFLKLMQTLLPQVLGQLPETLSDELLLQHNFMPINEAYKIIHFPPETETLKRAQMRLKFDEFFFIQLALLNQKNLHKANYRGAVFEKVGEHFNTFYEKYLPFVLTGAQKRVLKEIRADVRTGRHMNRLIQGDVGSGKTVVALLSMLMALDNGYQACLLAPTEILATQHYNGLKELLADMPVTIELLTSSVKQKNRRPMFEALANGSLHILVGTHALLEDSVVFKNLGLAVIDEQHRFGVEQRAKLWKKGPGLPPHILVMTATPIPRTLAMSLYGDLDISVIDELPPGRKPITTTHRFETGRLRVIGFMKEEIAKGRQIYVVFPLIEESEALDYKNLMDGYDHILRDFPRPQYQVSVVHGRMKPEDKEGEMQRFVRGETHIMVATTVIEVGVNVPNASVMIIENAERFGLSQLHQLRGRVGRGAEQSFCILMTSHKLTADARTRLETMCRTNDGFEIADVDLRLRGPGDLMGTRQSGLLTFKIADISKDQQLLHLARKMAEEILQKDIRLENPAHLRIRTEYIRQNSGKLKWGRIS